MSTFQQTILIGGAGIVGLAMAVALKAKLGAGAVVIVCDPAFASDAPAGAGAASGMRVSAVAPDARQLLEDLGVWEQVSDLAQAVNTMELTDVSPGDPVPHELFTLGAGAENGAPLAHIIANDDLLAALGKAAVSAGVVVRPLSVNRWSSADVAAGKRGEAILSDGSRVLADLLIAADGAGSRLRSLAGIGWHSWSYEQSGIVATVTHTRPHHGRATQHFMPSGPFAILPLTGNRSSIVWTERNDNLPALRALDQDELLGEIRRRFRLDRGDIGLAHFPPGVFPLALGLARRFYTPGMALIGDAAHLIHPLAGQGLNLGLRDVETLSQIVADSLHVGLPAANDEALRTYDRLRRADVLAMALSMEGLNRLFSNDLAPVRLVRDVGARLLGRSAMLRNLMVKAASGGR